MNKFRENEAVNIPNRTGRFQYRDGEWFLLTRENIELGPFESHAEAAVCLNEYIDFVEGPAAQEELEEFCQSYAVA